MLTNTVCNFIIVTNYETFLQLVCSNDRARTELCMTQCTTVLSIILKPLPALSALLSAQMSQVLSLAEACTLPDMQICNHNHYLYLDIFPVEYGVLHFYFTVIFLLLNHPLYMSLLSADFRQVQTLYLATSAQN